MICALLLCFSIRHGDVWEEKADMGDEKKQRAQPNFFVLELLKILDMKLHTHVFSRASRLASAAARLRRTSSPRLSLCDASSAAVTPP